MDQSRGITWRRAVVIAGAAIGLAMGIWIDYALGWSTTTIGFHIGSPPPPTLEDIVTSFLSLTLTSMILGCLLSRAIVWVIDDLAAS